MKRETILIILGVLIVLSPWSGLPLAWLSWVLPVLGLAVAAIGFTLRARSAPRALSTDVQSFRDAPDAEPRATRIMRS
ncbi:MAG: hypothetical protein V4480_04845 [Patescibacteria group bacterium]